MFCLYFLTPTDSSSSGHGTSFMTSTPTTASSPIPLSHLVGTYGFQQHLKQLSFPSVLCSWPRALLTFPLMPWKPLPSLLFPGWPVQYRCSSGSCPLSHSPFHSHTVHSPWMITPALEMAVTSYHARAPKSTCPAPRQALCHRQNKWTGWATDT